MSTNPAVSGGHVARFVPRVLRGVCCGKAPGVDVCGAEEAVVECPGHCREAGSCLA
ncbi:MAG TPA: hypothetical protein VM389_15355 [Phycisphaerae bacterium]|nr:hypothetical protein [Phycisphaerae bacterium]